LVSPALNYGKTQKPIVETRAFFALLFVALLFIIGAASLLWPGEETAPKKNVAQITVLFESKGKLQEESPVMYKNRKIGAVRSIQLGDRPAGPGGYYHVKVDVD